MFWCSFLLILSIICCRIAIIDSGKKRCGVKCKHRALSIAEQVEMLKGKKPNSGVSMRNFRETYDIGSSTVYVIYFFVVHKGPNIERTDKGEGPIY